MPWRMHKLGLQEEQYLGREILVTAHLKYDPEGDGGHCWYTKSSSIRGEQNLKRIMKS